MPNTFGISHVHLVLSHRHVLTQQIAFAPDNHLEFFSTLFMEEVISTFLDLSQAGTKNPS
jgi:hypothetical protein